MYFDFEAGNKAYKLRLTTKAIMALESKIGCNPLMVIVNAEAGRIPTITEMVHILHNSLTSMHHGITFEGATKIFEDWLSEGESRTPVNFVEIIVGIYRVSGIIPKTTESDEEAEVDEKN